MHNNLDRSPRFVLEFDTRSGNVQINKNQNIYPEPLKTEYGESILFIFGSPIINSVINRELISRSIIDKSSLDEGYLKKIDGEFLFILINKKNKTLELANDRYSSFSMFYFFKDNKVVLSHAYIDILEKISRFGTVHLKGDVLFEYLWFRRVFDDRTYDKYSRYLKPARVIRFYFNKEIESKYWNPQYVKNSNSLEANSNILRDLLINSLDKKLSDVSDKKVGLFLSGGMDTRTVLSLFDKCSNNIHPHCFTIGYSESGEYRVAKMLTNNLGVKHNFIKLDKGFYDHSWNEKLNMTGGLHNQFTILFSGYSKIMSENANIFFHGHALDYMFQGMYLPTIPYKFFGKKTYFKKIVNLHNITDFSYYFMNNIPFRTWKVKVQDYLLPQYRVEMLDGLHNKISLIAEEGRDVCNDNYDLWEYLMTHTPSRHYSQPDIIGMGANGEQRKIANDNALFDFYTSLPLQHRLYARVMRGALKGLSPEFSKIISANTGFKIDSGPMALTRHFAGLKFLRGVTNNSKFRHPQAADRTWPDMDFEVRLRPRLRKSIMNLPNSEALRDAMPFFDFEKLENDIKFWVEKGKPGGGLFLTSLLTIDNLANRFK
jgi:hypothetical protein